MAERAWLIYGASGYTGSLLAEEAVRRGHRPILAGRSAARLRPLAERLGLPARAAGLDDPAELDRLLDGVGLVLHAAGPFAWTSAPMVAACLRAGADYLDITGEVPVFEQVFQQDGAARAAGVRLLPGVGFDVVPSDCLAAHVAGQLPGARGLEIAVTATGGLSAGTLRSAIEHLPRGALVRRAGQLTPQRLGAGARRLAFTDGRGRLERTGLIASWGDLVTAFRSTGIPDITTYLCFPGRLAAGPRWAGPALQLAMRLGPTRRLAQAAAGRLVHGPSAALRESGRGMVWARAAGPDGQDRQAWLVTPETYRFTALAGIRCVERLLAPTGPAPGAATPAQLFGADFVLEIPGVQRFPALP